MKWKAFFLILPYGNAEWKCRNFFSGLSTAQIPNPTTRHLFLLYWRCSSHAIHILPHHLGVRKIGVIKVPEFSLSTVPLFILFTVSLLFNWIRFVLDKYCGIYKHHWFGMSHTVVDWYGNAPLNKCKHIEIAVYLLIHSPPFWIITGSTSTTPREADIPLILCSSRTIILFFRV